MMEIYFIVRSNTYFDRFLLLDEFTPNKAFVTKVKFTFKGIESLPDGIYHVEINKSDYSYNNGIWNINRRLYPELVLVNDKFKLFD